MQRDIAALQDGTVMQQLVWLPHSKKAVHSNLQELTTFASRYIPPLYRCCCNETMLVFILPVSDFNVVADLWYTEGFNFLLGIYIYIQYMFFSSKLKQ